MNISRKITNLRKSRGWTQSQLAEKLGISRNGLIELERRWPEKMNIKTLAAMAEVFCVTLEELLKGETFADV